MQSLARLQHLNELPEPPLARLRLLGVVQSVENRIAVLAVERLKELLCTGTCSQAARKSRGIVIVRWDAYAAFHRPSRFAASTCAWPAGVSRLWARKRSTAAQLIFDHLLRGPRGVKRCRHHPALLDAVCPSIHP